MKSTLEALEGNQVKLSIEVDESEFDRNIDKAFKKIATQVRIPGFRPGKAPRKLLEAQIGVGAARAQALEDAIPEYLTLAVREHEVDLIATPKVELVEGQESGTVKFDATCEVRPEITLPGYEGLRVEIVSPELSDDEIDEAVQSELRRRGTLADVDRPAQSGDHVVLDLEGTRDGQPVPGLNVDEWTYEIGRGWVAAGFDDQITGAKQGDEMSFTLVPNGSEEAADFTVKVVKVQEIVVPEVDDEWVAQNITDAETVAEWREMIRTRYEEMRANQMRSTLVDRLTDSLAQLVAIDPPESMVQGDLQARFQNTVQQMQAQGIPLEQWLQVTGQDPDSFVAGLKEQSEKAVRVDLALRAVAVARGIEIPEADLEAEFAAIATRVGEKMAKVRKLYEQNDAVGDLVWQMRKSQALDWLLHNVTYVDQNGRVMDVDDVLGPDHVHDHDDHSHDDHSHDQTAEDAQ
ncbi:MAG: trigger factor [Actinomycetota bacterium]